VPCGSMIFMGFMLGKEGLSVSSVLISIPSAAYWLVCRSGYCTRKLLRP
jgi:hypothetical protein